MLSSFHTKILGIFDIRSWKSFDFLVTVVLKILPNEIFEGMWVNLVVTTPGSPSYHFTEVSITIQSSEEVDMCSSSAGLPQWISCN